MLAEAQCVPGPEHELTMAYQPNEDIYIGTVMIIIQKVVYLQSHIYICGGPGNAMIMLAPTNFSLYHIMANEPWQELHTLCI